MKTAIYIEDGVVQLVITPESEFEKKALTSFEEKPLSAKIFTGSFYDCRGGWVRQNSFTQTSLVPTLNRENQDNSLIIQIKEKSPEDLTTQDE